MLFIPVLFLISIALILLRYRKRLDTPSPTNTEYWVFLPGVDLPDQNQVMEALFRQNRMTPQEGLLFSDIRLHTALVLREKNAHLFRPDLFEEGSSVTPEILTALANSHSLVKVRYLSDEPLKDDRYLALLPNLALVLSMLGNGAVIYDLIQRELFSTPEFEKLIGKRAESKRAEAHVRVVWEKGLEPFAMTHGLRKKGLPELRSKPMEADEEFLVTNLMFEAARDVWDKGQLPATTEVEMFGDLFHLSYRPSEKNPGRYVEIQMMREQRG